MVTLDQVKNVIGNIAGIEDLEDDASFAELGMDSSAVLEVLIEFELLLEIDLLSDSLNLTDFVTLADIANYLNQLLESRGAQNEAYRPIC